MFETDFGPFEKHAQNPHSGARMTAPLAKQTNYCMIFQHLRKAMSGSTRSTGNLGCFAHRAISECIPWLSIFICEALSFAP